MYDQTAQTVIAPLATLSLDKLAEFAIEEKLIDRFELAGSDVTIFQADRRFRLPHRQASTFLIGMLRGRSWYVDDPRRENAQSSAAGIHSEPVTADAEQPATARSIDATLEALLTFTKDVGIILGYRKDADSRSVHIDISACSSVFSYVDAVAYLFDCVQHQVRITTEAA